MKNKVLSRLSALAEITLCIGLVAFLCSCKMRSRQSSTSITKRTESSRQSATSEAAHQQIGSDLADSNIENYPVTTPGPGFTCLPNQERINGLCVQKCPSNKDLVNGRCVAKCPLDQERVDSQCVMRCTGNQERVRGVCVSPCDNSEKRVAGVCVPK